MRHPGGEIPHLTRKASAPAFSSTRPALSLSLLFLASRTASRDGAVGEGRCGERVGWYLLSTAFAGKEAVFLQTRHEYKVQVN